MDSSDRCLRRADAASAKHQACCLIIEDITEQLKLEAQLRQSQKMEVVGRMSAGIAHEFNNLLTVIQGNTGLLKTIPMDEAGRQNLLDQIMQACQRAANLTRQLLSFSRKQVLQPKRLNLSDVVQRMKKMLGRSSANVTKSRCPAPPNCRPSLPTKAAWNKFSSTLSSTRAMP